MNTLFVYLIEGQVTEYRLMEYFLGNELIEITFVEILGEQFLLSIEYTQSHADYSLFVK